MNSSYYHRLNLQDGASIHEIKNAYRRLALRYHPDKSVSTRDAEKFKSITEAYQILKAGRNSYTSHIFHDTPFARNGFTTLRSHSSSPLKIFNNIWQKYAKYTKKIHHDFKYTHGAWRYRAMVWRSTTSAFIHLGVSRCIQVPLTDSQIHVPALLSRLKTGLKEKAIFLQRAFQPTARMALSQCQAIHNYLHLPTARPEMIKIGPAMVQTINSRNKIDTETELVPKVPTRKEPFEDNLTEYMTRDKNPMTYNIWTSCKSGRFALISERDTAYFAAVPQFMEKCYRTRPYGAKSLAETEPTKTYYGRISTGDVLADPTIRWRSRHTCLA